MCDTKVVITIFFFLVCNNWIHLFACNWIPKNSWSNEFKKELQKRQEVMDIRWTLDLIERCVTIDIKQDLRWDIYFFII